MRLAIALLLFCVTCRAQSYAQPLSDANAPFLLSTSSLRIGLVGYWRLEESSGTRYDCSKNGNHLTDNNSVGQAAGIQQNAATFVSSSSQSLTKADNATFPRATNSSFSVAGWYYPSNLSSVKVWLSKSNGGGDETFAIFSNGTTPTLQMSGGSYQAACGHVTLATGVWHFWVGTWNVANSNLTLYVDNCAGHIKTGVVPPSGNSQPFGIGRYQGSTLWADGRVDEVGYWNRILTASEITFLYQSGRGTHFPWAHP